MMFRHEIIFISAALVMISSCGPDAPHDNPLDPANQGSGVYGTVYQYSGGVIIGAVITARPNNITTNSGQNGDYSLRLEPGRYLLEAACGGYQTAVDTIDVPRGAMVKHNFIMKGLAGFDSALVCTRVWRSWNNIDYYLVVPWCLAFHPEGTGFLDNYSFLCRIDTFAFLPDSVRNVDDNRRRYYFSISQVPGVGNFPQWVVGRRMDFLALSSNHSVLVQRTVPNFLEPVPYNLQPNNNQVFSLPDTLRWENQLTNVNLSLEIHSGLNLIWQRDIPFTNRYYCDAILPQSGIYAWKVVMRDASGNMGAAEATFYQP